MSENTPDPTRILDQEIYRDLYERRIIVLGDALEQDTSNRLCTSLLLLASRDSRADIVLLINSPGGSVPGMLAIRDTMRAIPNDVATVNIGMAYSAGQFLLSSGTPGKRFSLPHAKVLLHQGSGGIGGTAQDIEIQAADMRHTRDMVLACIAADTGKDVRQGHPGLAARPMVHRRFGTGHRSILRNGRVVLTAPATEGGRGTIPDLIIEAEEMERIRRLQEAVLASHCGRTAQQVRADTERQLVLAPDAAVDYVIVDHVLTRREAPGS